MWKFCFSKPCNLSVIFIRPWTFFINFSWARLSNVSVHPFHQLFWPNYSSICLCTIYSSYPLLGEYFKRKIFWLTKKNPPHLLLALPKNWSRTLNWPKIGPHLVWLYHWWKVHGNRFQKVQKYFDPLPPTSCFTQQLVSGPKMSKNWCSLSMVVS